MAIIKTFMSAKAKARHCPCHVSSHSKILRAGNNINTISESVSGSKQQCDGILVPCHAPDRVNTFSELLCSCKHCYDVAALAPCHAPSRRSQQQEVHGTLYDRVFVAPTEVYKHTSKEGPIIEKYSDHVQIPIQPGKELEEEEIKKIKAYRRYTLVWHFMRAFNVMMVLGLLGLYIYSCYTSALPPAFSKGATHRDRPSTFPFFLLGGNRQVKAPTTNTIASTGDEWTPREIVSFEDLSEDVQRNIVRKMLLRLAENVMDTRFNHTVLREGDASSVLLGSGDFQ